MKRYLLPFIIALLASALFTGLLYVDFYQTLDSRLFDLMLRIKPGIKEDKSVLLLEVDDQTITEINKYPLPRDIFADGLILLKEFEPSWTMLDIEFVDASEDAIDYNYLDDGMYQDIYAAFDNITAYQRQLVELILSGTISRNEALDYLDDLETSGMDTENQLLDDLKKITYSRDDYLGKAIGYLKDVSATVNMTEEVDNTIPEDLRAYAVKTFRINDYLTLNDDPFPSSVEILPAIGQVLESSAWAGFPRMHIDPDGVRRRIDVIYKNNGNYYTHMGFGTWWVRQGRPHITVNKGSMTVGDLTIPLDEDGKLLINWPKRLYDGTPLNKKAAKGFDTVNPQHRLSFYYLYYHDRLMEDLISFTTELEDYGISSDIYGNSSLPLSALLSDLDTLKAAMLSSGDGSKAGEYGKKRDEFLSEVDNFLNGDAEQFASEDIQAALENPDISDEDYNFYGDLYQRIPYLFSESRSILEDIQSVRTQLRNHIKGAVIVAGYTGTSTTDYGANPFERKYMNMGIYGAVYNSLLQGDFIREIPPWITGIIALLTGMVVSLLSNISRKNSILNTILGAGFLALAIAGSGAFFVLSGTYVHLLPIILTLLFAYLGTVIGNFISASKEKAFIQGAFDQVISPDVVKRIQENPDMLKLGGETRVITAMFTDIERFSTISEKLGTSDKLFDLLKRYLTPMSDIILDEQGTIDKYEGDAIIAFWNAPLDQENHAHRACRAAMRIVEMERQIHKELVAEGILTKEIITELEKNNGHGRLFTRIGIHTGENHIGFIGTDRRKDYTALGDNMNLAARLEGVNKTYDTQVLISDETEGIIHEDFKFYTRQLDMVRVIGKKKPVTIYELSYSKEFKTDLSKSERELFRDYRQALIHFRDKEWDKAEKLFSMVLKTTPNDGPSKVFVERCRKYRVTPPPANWDGVYKMETK